MIVKCDYCGKNFNKRPRDLKKTKSNYCSKNCKNTAQKTGYKVKCSECNNVLYRSQSEYANSESKTFFCNRSCSASFNNKKRYKNTEKLKDYRVKIFRVKEEVCERCGFKEYPSILQVHHKDHNRKNNDIENLEVLCPNCHMIEHLENYGSTNNKPDKEII